MLQQANERVLVNSDGSIELSFYKHQDGLAICPISKITKERLRFRLGDSESGYLYDDIFLTWLENQEDGMYYLFYLKYEFTSEDEKRYAELVEKGYSDSKQELAEIYQRATKKYEPFIGTLEEVALAFEGFYNQC